MWDLVKLNFVQQQYEISLMQNFYAVKWSESLLGLVLQNTLQEAHALSE